jgi:Na+/proline symporter
MNLTLIGIASYVAIQLIVVFAIVRRMRARSESDYLLAGRRFGPGLATFAIFATWFGAETCIGAAGSVYGGGLSDSVHDPFGYTVCLLLMGFLFAARLWQRKLTTFADLYRQRYSPGVERFAALLLIPTSVMWAAAQIRALGQVVSATSSFDLEIAIAVAAGVVVLYTVYGGLLADAVADVFQGIMIMIGLAVLLFVVVDAAGGIQAAAATVDPKRLSLIGDQTLLEHMEHWAIPIAGSALAQELVAVVLASRSPEIARRSALMGGALYFSFGLIPVILGLIGVALLPNLDEPEQLLPRLAEQYLGTLPFILFVGAIVSAILSTVAGALLAASALAQHNVIAPLRPSLNASARVWITRACVVVAGTTAYVLALHATSVYDMVADASSFGSAGFFTVAVIGLFSRFGGVRAAYCTLVVGSATWLLGTHVFELAHPYLTALAAAVTTYIAVGLTERPSPTSTQPA